MCLSSYKEGLPSGLLKNAIENTPDEGRVEIFVKKKGAGTLLEVRDFGVGITSENQIRIFEGFFTTRETMDYSSKNPYDFNAGGKGADLLRIKIFSERYGFKIVLKSSRCPLIPHETTVLILFQVTFAWVITAPLGSPVVPPV